MSKIAIINLGNNKLAQKIAKNFKTKIIEVEANNFKDGEFHCKILDSVRNKDVFIIHSIKPPVNDNLMKVLILIDALNRSHAKSINLITPYLGYSRQDRVPELRTPLTAKLVANLIEAAGTDRVITLELHSAQIQGFYNIPLENLRPEKIFANYLKKQNLTDTVIASPDVGGVVRANRLARELKINDLVIIDKRRQKANQCEVFNIIGDVKNKNVIIYDDMIDTGGTITKAAKALKDAGAKSVIGVATHGLLSGDADQKILDSQFDKVLLSDSIEYNGQNPKIEVLSSAQILIKSINLFYKN